MDGNPIVERAKLSRKMRWRVGKLFAFCLVKSSLLRLNYVLDGNSFDKLTYLPLKKGL